jgi:hypothetical protein
MRKYPQWLGVNARRENRVETHRAVNAALAPRNAPHAARRNAATPQRFNVKPLRQRQRFNVKPLRRAWR